MKKTTKNEIALKQHNMNFGMFTPTEAGKIFQINVSGAKLKSGAYKTFLGVFDIDEVKELIKYILKYRVEDFKYEDLDDMIKQVEYLKQAKKKNHQEKILTQIELLQKQLEKIAD